jgi:proteasome lid subunit RPN8/RPN11
MPETIAAPPVVLDLPAAVRLQIEREAAAAFPEECCGLLIGPVPGDFGENGMRLQVRELRPLKNAWESQARTHRYTADPAEFAAVERELAGGELAILGVYHSHPSVPAWPSPFDLMRAWPNYAYVIASVRAGQTSELRVWRLSADGRSFLEGALPPSDA